MPFDPNSNAQEFHCVIEIALDAKTFYLSFDYLTLDNETAYEGIITSMSPLSNSAGPILDPRLELPHLRIGIDNKTDTIDGSRFQDNIDQYDWANRTVTLKVGQGTAAANYETIFVGVVQFPSGISFDDDSVYIRVQDARSTDAKILPPNAYNKTTYPNMELKSVGLSIPIVYGDWRSSAANGEQLPCVQIDSTTGTGGKFKIANHALKTVDTVYKNGSSVAFTADAANGEFTLNVSYAPDTDTITTNCQGSTVDGTTSGALLQAAPDVFEDVLETWLSVPSANIDDTALTAWGSNLTTNDYVRRFIGADIESSTLLAELLSDTFADLSLQNGKYTPVYRIVTATSATDSFMDEDIINSGRKKMFSVNRDPERITANEINTTYNYAPADSKYNGSYRPIDSGAVVQQKTTQRRSLNMNWLYIQTGAQNRTDLELRTWTQEVEVIEVDFTAIASAKLPTDQFRVAYSKYPDNALGGIPFMARQTNLNPKTLQTHITAWSMVSLAPHLWTNDAAPNWKSATAAQRAQQGFWLNADGEADPAYFWADASAPNWASSSSTQKADQSYWTNDSGEADPGDAASAGSAWRSTPDKDNDSVWI